MYGIFEWLFTQFFVVMLYIYVELNVTQIYLTVKYSFNSFQPTSQPFKTFVFPVGRESFRWICRLTTLINDSKKRKIQKLERPVDLYSVDKLKLTQSKSGITCHPDLNTSKVYDSGRCLYAELQKIYRHYAVFHLYNLCQSKRLQLLKIKQIKIVFFSVLDLLIPQIQSSAVSTRITSNKTYGKVISFEKIA